MNRLKEHLILEHRTRLFLVKNVINVNNFLLHHKNRGTDFLTFCTSKIIKNQMEKNVAVKTDSQYWIAVK